MSRYTTIEIEVRAEPRANEYRLTSPALSSRAPPIRKRWVLDVLVPTHQSMDSFWRVLDALTPRLRVATPIVGGEGCRCGNRYLDAETGDRRGAITSERTM